MAHLLLVEDNASIIENLKLTLREAGYTVTTASTQAAAMDAIDGGVFDLILLDLSLPDGNGFAVCTYAKRQGDTPVIFLTAADDEASVVTGFDLGADDFISKPFRPLELLSRIKSILRRAGKTQSQFKFGDLEVDSLKGTVHKNGQELFLSALEYRLLLIFLNNQGIVLSRSKLLEEIWDIAGEYVNDNTLTVYIKRLREKIEDDPQDPTVIRTIRGLGYKVGD